MVCEDDDCEEDGHDCGHCEGVYERVDAVLEVSVGAVGVLDPLALQLWQRADAHSLERGQHRALVVAVGRVEAALHQLELSCRVVHHDEAVVEPEPVAHRVARPVGGVSPDHVRAKHHFLKALFW